MKIGTIVEGPTDRLLLKAIIDELCPGPHEYRDLQPADGGSSFGKRGTGWKGVRRFCFDIWQNLGQSVADFIETWQFDLLVIHVDADIALENDLQDRRASSIDPVSQPCPPIDPTIKNLHDIIARWLKLDAAKQLPAQVMLAIPAQDSENWIFAALFPEDELCEQDDYKCLHSRNSRQHPAFLLTLSRYKPTQCERRIARRKDGKIKKNRQCYRRVLPDVIAAWDEVCQICSQAQSFSDNLVDRRELLD